MKGRRRRNGKRREKIIKSRIDDEKKGNYSPFMIMIYWRLEKLERGWRMKNEEWIIGKS